VKIAIVGAGWFGCHLGVALGRDHDVTVFEKRSKIFLGTSGVNQNRLHQGFHYPRSASTREHTQMGFDEFLAAYPEFCEPIEHNLYAIAEHVSLMDFDTYRVVMDAQGLEYEVVDPDDYGLTNVEGCIRCGEMLIRNDLAAVWFEKELRPRIAYREFKFDDLDGWDAVINCSSQQSLAHPDWDLVYEPCVMLNYDTVANQPAVTVMDGPLCTVYPRWPGRYTLYSVEHSTRGRFDSWEKAAVALSRGVDRGPFERLIDTYAPWFKDYFQFAGMERSMRVTFGDAARSRVPHVGFSGGVIQVMPCKIDNIFQTERAIRQLLGI
jgi:regulator of RNase E activity RraB